MYEAIRPLRLKPMRVCTGFVLFLLVSGGSNMRWQLKKAQQTSGYRTE